MFFPKESTCVFFLSIKVTIAAVWLDSTTVSCISRGRAPLFVPSAQSRPSDVGAILDHWFKKNPFDREEFYSSAFFCFLSDFGSCTMPLSKTINLMWRKRSCTAPMPLTLLDSSWQRGINESPGINEIPHSSLIFSFYKRMFQNAVLAVEKALRSFQARCSSQLWIQVFTASAPVIWIQRSWQQHSLHIFPSFLFIYLSFCFSSVCLSALKMSYFTVIVHVWQWCITLPPHLLRLMKLCIQ